MNVQSTSYVHGETDYVSAETPEQEVTARSLRWIALTALVTALTGCGGGADGA